MERDGGHCTADGVTCRKAATCFLSFCLTRLPSCVASVVGA
jgi:hypothetical protein